MALFGNIIALLIDINAVIAVWKSNKSSVVNQGWAKQLNKIFLIEILCSKNYSFQIVHYLAFYYYSITLYLWFILYTLE